MITFYIIQYYIFEEHIEGGTITPRAQTPVAHNVSYCIDNRIVCAKKPQNVKYPLQNVRRRKSFFGNEDEQSTDDDLSWMDNTDELLLDMNEQQQQQQNEQSDNEQQDVQHDEEIDEIVKELERGWSMHTMSNNKQTISDIGQMNDITQTHISQIDETILKTPTKQQQKNSDINDSNNESNQQDQVKLNFTSNGDEAQHPLFLSSCLDKDQDITSPQQKECNQQEQQSNMIIDQINPTPKGDTMYFFETPQSSFVPYSSSSSSSQSSSIQTQQQQQSTSLIYSNTDTNTNTNSSTDPDSSILSSPHQRNPYSYSYSISNSPIEQSTSTPQSQQTNSQIKLISPSMTFPVFSPPLSPHPTLINVQSSAQFRKIIKNTPQNAETPPNTPLPSDLVSTGTSHMMTRLRMRLLEQQQQNLEKENIQKNDINELYALGSIPKQKRKREESEECSGRGSKRLRFD
ncbi:MAG: hypothetical protein EZS28_035478 [Streblomastix strix]|uniref:Uncharacterized protein n=1 Tax=Streblomastix strix TaxID=222440 RepID=A0A5J4UDW9_9EUKA|nr:MAG: hypothetical protein EZS28_035478 [Streblomastix strix]